MQVHVSIESVEGVDGSTVEAADYSDALYQVLEEHGCPLDDVLVGNVVIRIYAT